MLDEIVYQVQGERQAILKALNCLNYKNKNREFHLTVPPVTIASISPIPPSPRITDPSD